MRRNRPILDLILCGALLIAAIAFGTAMMVFHFRDRALANSERELKNTALMLTRHVDQELEELDLVQKSIIERMQSAGIASSHDYERQMSNHDIHLMLKDKSVGLPYLGTFTLINAQGKLFNFSRSWPIPDASGPTIEVVEGSGYRRMVENLRRWSGNMLRNGWRAIMLGPTRMPFFIWWCCIDQRVAMWTMLFSPMIAIAGCMKFGSSYLLAYTIYIAVSRMMLSLVLFTYARRVDLNFVWTLYVNQILNAVVKIYMQWRLAKQKWTNRGNQKAGFAVSGWLTIFREGMAFYMTALSFVSVFLIVMVYTRLLSIPSLGLLSSLIFQ